MPEYAATCMAGVLSECKAEVNNYRGQPTDRVLCRIKDPDIQFSSCLLAFSRLRAFAAHHPLVSVLHLRAPKNASFATDSVRRHLNSFKRAQ